MITVKSDTAITCDKCGRQIADGETWHQLTVSATTATFDGTASGLVPDYELVTQLCDADYAPMVASVQGAAPLSVSTVAVSVPPPL